MAVPSGLAQTKCCSCSRCSQPPRTPPQQPGTDGMLLAASSPAPSLPASFCLNDATSFVLLIEATDQLMLVPGLQCHRGRAQLCPGGLKGGHSAWDSRSGGGDFRV
ncbi:uncharacterized protein ACIB01_014869 isoform 2-T2 [Guaruba guarouba]